MKDKNKESFIEETGLLFESLGLTRMSGRIVGSLLVSTEEMISFNEFTILLNASKSSISTNLKMLVSFGFIKITTLPADRKTYYTLNHDIDWSEILAKELKFLRLFQVILNKAGTLRENKKDKSSVWVQKAVKFNQWVGKEMYAILEKYNNAEKTY